jgi:hypothetical protein
MKSLKDIPSIRQVRLDHMLEITPQPDNTCPLIDPLIYIGRRRSPLYDLELDYEPSDLLLDESRLAERIETLELWASEVLDVYALIDKSSIDEEDFIDIDDYRKNIETKIANNKMHEVSSMVELINNIIYEWKDLHLDYLSIDRDLNRAEQEVYKLESNFDLNDEDDGYIEALEGIEHAKEEVESIKEKLEDLKEEFNSDITRQFEKSIAKFTDLMEYVRANNDSLRQETKQLRDMVIQYVNHDFNVVQPMDYLKQLESGKPDEISLGLVDTDYYLHSFSNLTDYLKRNGVLSDIQIVLLRKTESLTDLLDGLKEMGYKKVMYYDDAKISMKYPEIYKEVNFNDELIKDNKNKPRI